MKPLISNRPSRAAGISPWTCRSMAPKRGKRLKWPALICKKFKWLTWFLESWNESWAIYQDFVVVWHQLGVPSVNHYTLHACVAEKVQILHKSGDLQRRHTAIFRYLSHEQMLGFVRVSLIGQLENSQRPLFIFPEEQASDCQPRAQYLTYSVGWLTLPISNRCWSRRSWRVNMIWVFWRLSGSWRSHSCWLNVNRLTHRSPKSAKAGINLNLPWLCGWRRWPSWSDWSWPSKWTFLARHSRLDRPALWASLRENLDSVKSFPLSGTESFSTYSSGHSWCLYTLRCMAVKTKVITIKSFQDALWTSFYLSMFVLKEILKKKLAKRSWRK